MGVSDNRRPDQADRTGIEAAMGKTVKASKLTEWKGLDRISAVVHEMKNIWREMTKDDFGLDGEIEVVSPKPDGKGFETTGGIVKVQAKAGESYIRFDSEASFTTPVDQDDLIYWNACTFPVLFIVYHPRDDKLYFKEVKEYIRATPDVFSKPHQIRFDKAADEFTGSSKSEVVRHAGASPSRISFDQKEKLFSNLLPVRKLPATLFRAATRRKSRDSIRDEIKGYVPPFCVVDGMIYSLSDPADEHCPLRKFCIGRFGSVEVGNWLADGRSVNDFIYLMNQLLRKQMGRCGVRYNPEFRRYYFPRENQESLEFKRPWTSTRTGVSDERTVAKYYEYGADKFWRHLAAQARICRMGGKWFLHISPMYFFTEDGEKPCGGELAGPYTTSLKADEKNNHVLNHVLFWADVLAPRRSSIELRLDGEVLVVIDKRPLTGLAAFAIPDDPAIYKEEAPTRQMSLFGAQAGEDDGDEY